MRRCQQLDKPCLVSHWLEKFKQTNPHFDSFLHSITFNHHNILFLIWSLIILRVTCVYPRLVGFRVGAREGRRVGAREGRRVGAREGGRVGLSENPE